MSTRWIGPVWLRRPLEALGLRLYQRSIHLTLFGPQFDDEAIDLVMKLKRLKTLQLSATKISDAGLARLQAALPDCKITGR